jgi:hypothetical protein
VATYEGTELNLSAGLGGEYHVVALHFQWPFEWDRRGLKLEVKDQQGYAVDTLSQQADGVAQVFTPIAWDTRLVQANAKEEIELTVKVDKTSDYVMPGCALVAAFRRF